ncbi:hypothetical protein BCR44DRAFT_1441195, partial [Catenaria anguillulae PL171]
MHFSQPLAMLPSRRNLHFAARLSLLVHRLLQAASSHRPNAVGHRHRPGLPAYPPAHAPSSMARPSRVAQDEGFSLPT